MKQIVAILLGYASASNFLDESATELIPIGSGACINWKGSELYDLTKFDREYRDETA